jgi:effector-binding domain-containing protein
MTDLSSLTETEIVELEPTATVSVRVKQPMADLDLAAAFDRYLPLVLARVQEVGSEIAGPPFGRYHRFGPDEVDVEIGFPVKTAPPGLAPLHAVGSGDVGLSELPGGPVARTVHRGPYDGLGGTYDALHEWIHAQQGYDDGPGPWESYVDDPGAVTEIADARTEVLWPLVRT